MARRKPKPPVEILGQTGVEVVDIDPIGGETDTRGAVRHVDVKDSRQLITVPVDSPIWGGSPPHTRAMKQIAGAIVRLRPPEKATDDDVEGIRGFFLKYGASKVVVLPRPRSELLPSKAEKATAVGAREAVTTLIAESNSKDRTALENLCEKVMAEVGL